MEKFEFIVECINAIGTVDKFKVSVEEAKWRPVLKWWLWPESTGHPTPKHIAKWHKQVNSDFGYRCSWGIGSIIGYAFDRVDGDAMEPLSLEKWDMIDLPWAIFWLKELLAWGTLEPVAAFLLTNGMELTRANAEQSASGYYSQTSESESDQLLDPRSIRDWAMAAYHRASEKIASVIHAFTATIQDSSFKNVSHDLRVIPVVKNNRVEWFDVAGHHLCQFCIC